MEIKQNQIVVRDQLITYFVSKHPLKKIPIVFLHGWAAESSYWYGAVDKLAKKRSLYFIDLPGFGGSQVPLRAYGLDDYADIVLSLISKIGINKYILAGHSFGGSVAVSMVNKDKNNAVKLILIASSGIRPKSLRKTLLQKLSVFTRPFFKPVFMQGFRKYVYKKLKSTDYLETQGIMRETYRRILNEDITDRLNKINQHTLIVWGENDRETSVTNAKIFEGRIKNSVLIVFPGAGHFCFANEPDKFQNEIINFLTES